MPASSNLQNRHDRKQSETPELKGSIHMNMPVKLNTPTSISTALAEYGASVTNAVPGERIKFVKGGWYLGDEVVRPDEKFRVNIHGLTRIWERWCEQRIVDRIVAPLGDRLPPRDVLGFDDKSRWEPGLDGVTRGTRGRRPITLALFACVTTSNLPTLLPQTEAEERLATSRR
jgi:hypothetical protein